ncbi:unnamed protein product [Lactuca saligna]|uniref:Uncharacterized protein n=1 Tax=Lactuca saligna TaxID=75948 RepID=A0AA35YTH3_LACSI|nr:unnamed protein product [Lactuca saligna]
MRRVVSSHIQTYSYNHSYNLNNPSRRIIQVLKKHMYSDIRHIDMVAIMKQIQHQLKQKQEQKASLIRQLEAANREEEQLQQIQQILSSYLAVKDEATRSSTTKQPKEDIQEISSDDSQSQTIHKTEKQPMASNQEEYLPLQADHKNIKKRYVIINEENK